jgi:5'/3'-nucleotidase SurE
MSVKRILITGDDGYNSIGTRILIHLLKDKYDLFVAATRNQMSGVGGHVSLKHGGKWGKTELEGVPVFWVDGYPCDVMECIPGNFDGPYDLVLSGINQGMNIGGTIFSSGTYAAANRAVNLKIAPRAMVLSWNCPPSFWTKKHTGNEDLTKYLKYPGTAAFRVIDKAVAENFWGAELLNVNFPTEPSYRVRFTQELPDVRKFYRYPTSLNHKTHEFKYPPDPLSQETKGRLKWDTGAMLAGYISISPQRISNTDVLIYEKMKDVTFDL